MGKRGLGTVRTEKRATIQILRLTKRPLSETAHIFSVTLYGFDEYVSSIVIVVGLIVGLRSLFSVAVPRAPQPYGLLHAKYFVLPYLLTLLLGCMGIVFGIGKPTGLGNCHDKLFKWIKHRECRDNDRRMYTVFVIGRVLVSCHHHPSMWSWA